MEDKDTSTTENEDVEAHGYERALEDVEAHGYERPPEDREAASEDPDVEGHGFEKPPFE